MAEVAEHNIESYETLGWIMNQSDEGFYLLIASQEMQSIVVDNGKHYDRLAATRGTDYLLVYNYTSRDMKIDLRKISGEKKKVWWMDARTGKLTWLGEYDNKILTFRPHKTDICIEDGVLIAIDSSKTYLWEE